MIVGAAWIAACVAVGTIPAHAASRSDEAIFSYRPASFWERAEHGEVLNKT
jgi:hypothetical protein